MGILAYKNPEKYLIQGDFNKECFETLVEIDKRLNKLEEKLKEIEKLEKEVTELKNILISTNPPTKSYNQD